MLKNNSLGSSDIGVLLTAKIIPVNTLDIITIVSNNIIFELLYLFQDIQSPLTIIIPYP